MYVAIDFFACKANVSIHNWVIPTDILTNFDWFSFLVVYIIVNNLCTVLKWLVTFCFILKHCSVRILLIEIYRVLKCQFCNYFTYQKCFACHVDNTQHSAEFQKQLIILWTLNSLRKEVCNSSLKGNVQCQLYFFNSFSNKLW